MGKAPFCICENKGTDQLHGDAAQLISAFFHYMDSKNPLLLNQKFQVSNHNLWLYSLVCVGPGCKP